METFDYEPIDFSDTIKNFVSWVYTPYHGADDEPVSGTIDDSFGLLPGGVFSGVNYSAITINDENDDLHHIQVVLMEEIDGNPDEFILLGSTYPDTSAVFSPGTITYDYKWDQEWLSLNGIPAYISDIQFFEVEDENGDVAYSFTRVFIPAVLNPGTANEKDISLSFTYDDAFNHKLEEIFCDPTAAHISIPSKERIDLQAGDVIQLKYEIFDAVTHEGVFEVDEEATIEIENGNQDLDLGHAMLKPGNYHLGFLLMDHSHNDTLIYDPTVRVVDPVNTIDITNDVIQMSMSPNPTFDELNINFTSSLNTEIQIIDQKGSLILYQKINQGNAAQFNVSNLPSGTYFVQLIRDGKTVTKQFVKP